MQRAMIRSYLIATLFMAFQAMAQSQGKVTGSVAENGQPVEFATVLLSPVTDSTRTITGAVTAQNGGFTIEGVPSGIYDLRVRMVGYHSVTMRVSIAGDLTDMGLIALQADTVQLSTLEVRATREMIKKTDQGLTLEASANLTQIGGTAADLLRNMPGVLVGADGDVTVRGKTPMTLINGRVSGMAGIDRAAQLQQIPASSIERIEIIHNPSARYDADSEGGIINIVLKKNSNAGTNGAFALGMGRGDRNRINASALLNHHPSDRWNLGLAYDNWYTTRTRWVKGDRTNYDIPDKYFLIQRRSDERLVFYQNARVNLDYTPDKKNTLNMEVLWAFPGEDNRETLNNTFRTDAGGFTDANRRFSNEIRRSNTIETSVKYTRKGEGPDRSLTVNLSDALNLENEKTGINTSGLTEAGAVSGTSSVQRTRVNQHTNLLNFSVDKVDPVGTHALLESGYKGIMRYLRSDYERATLSGSDYVFDPLNTNIFTFNEQIHAAYVQLSGWSGDRETGRWRYQAGIRAEQVWNHGSTIDRSTVFSNSYFNLFPSANLKFQATARTSLRASYGRRIARPGLGQLSPFTDITDSLNQRSGNPGLKPELIHSFEVSWNTDLKKGSLSLVGFYRLRNRAILPYTVLDANGVAFTRPENFGTAVTWGGEAIGTWNPSAFYSSNLGLSAFQVVIDGSGADPGLNKKLFSWYAKWVSNFTISSSGKLQVTANYTAPTAIPQGRSVAVGFVDLGYQHRMLSGKGRLGVVVTDVFNTQKTGQVTSDTGFTFRRISKQDTRAVMLTFGYTLGSSFREKLMENRFKND